MRCLHTTRMSKIKRLQIWGATGTCVHHWWECSHFGNLYFSFLKVKHTLIRLPSSSPRDWQMSKNLYKDFKWMLIAALFTIALNWKQPKCSLTGDLINRFGISIQGILLSNKKEWTDTYKNKDESHKHYSRWKVKYKSPFCMIPFIWNSKKDQKKL